MIFPGFDSFADLREALAEVQRDVTAARQRGMTHGEFWCGPSPDGRGVRFGKIATVAELDARSRRHGASEDELASSRDERAEDYERGYRFGRAYSLIRPEGEWGSTHVSQMIAKLSPTQFEAARNAGWDFGVLVRLGLTWPNPLLHRSTADGGRSV